MIIATLSNWRINDTKKRLIAEVRLEVPPGMPRPPVAFTDQEFPLRRLGATMQECHLSNPQEAIRAMVRNRVAAWLDMPPHPAGPLRDDVLVLGVKDDPWWESHAG